MSYPGDVLHLSVYTPWEFSGESPIRSVVVPYIITAPAFYLLKFLGLDSDSNALLVIPRVFIALLSFVADLLVYRTATALSLDSYAITMTYVTSYITLVYHTRTLSNTVEAFLFVMLLYLVITCGKREVKTTNAYVRPRSKLTKATRTVVATDNNIEWSYIIGIAVVLVLGFFNRPTFLLFAFVPCMYWICNGSVSLWKDELSLISAVMRTISLLIIAVPLKCVFILADSIYYNDWKSPNPNLQDWLSSIYNFVVFTPLNFLKYNTDITNLAEHTLHSRFLHFIVNAQLLFGFLGLFAIIAVLQTISMLKYMQPNHEYTWKILVLYSYIVPMLFLSMIPHQEPRFLIPLLLPLAMLFGHHIYGALSSQTCKVLWIGFNIPAALFYGILHQGGLTTAIATIQQQHTYVANTNYNNSIFPQHHVIFYNTYMPPRHLFAIPSNSSNIESLQLHDLKGEAPVQIVKLVQKINKYASHPVEIYLLSPRTAEVKFCDEHVKALRRLHFRIVHQFYPHVSMENLPSFTEVLAALYDNIDCTTCTNSIICKGGLTGGLAALFSLNLYQITLA